jgi:hypothetical protein
MQSGSGLTVSYKQIKMMIRILVGYMYMKIIPLQEWLDL